MCHSWSICRVILHLPVGLAGWGEEGRRRDCALLDKERPWSSHFCFTALLISFLFTTESNKHYSTFSKCVSLGLGALEVLLMQGKDSVLWFSEQSCQCTQVCTPLDIIQLNFKPHFYTQWIIILIIWNLFHTHTQRKI